MIRFILIPVLLCVFLTHSQPAKAGFEWVPPSEKPKPVADPLEIDLDQILNLKQNERGEIRILPTYRPPAPSLDARTETLRRSPARTFSTMGNSSGFSPMPSELSRTPRLPSASSIVRGQTRTLENNRNVRSGGLYIDPFPMGQNTVNNDVMEMSEKSVEQAMIEDAGFVTPMGLGGQSSGQSEQTMQTGAQIARTFEDTVSDPTTNPATGFGLNDFSPVSSMGAVTRNVPRQEPILQFTDAVGFGSEIPLAVAIDQIVPDEFTHSYAVGVDPGTTVSWQGGKPWNQVLEETLKPQGLTAVIRQNTVMIQQMARL